MRLTDEELIAAIEAEESAALDNQSGELRQERADAWARYRGEPLGNEIEGRSQIVDKSVMDTIQWIVPSLVRIYLGGDNIGQFEAVGPEDEYASECETDVCNWYLQQKNDFYSHIVATLTDALLLKNGYIAGMWTVRRDVMTEEYRGLADEEFAMLVSDPEVAVVEHSEYLDPAMGVPLDEATGMPLPGAMLHDCKVERKKADEFVGIESIPPDEMLVARRHRWTSLADADFVQWRRRVSVGQLRAEGFKVPEDVEGYTDFGLERIERERFDPDNWANDETPDPSRKIVLFKDTYLRIDLRDEGTPQLWRVAYVEGMKEPVLKEEADIVPFAAFAPIIYPHSHIGTSIYDLINDVSLIKTMMQRQLVDGTFMQVSGMMGVDVNTVNVDDLLVRRPGGMVRVEGEPGAGLFPIQTPDVGPTVMASLEYMEAIKEGRTGVTRYSAGLDANTLNKTASGVQAIQAAANQRIELIARTMASGFRDLFMIVHALASKHSTKPIQLKLKGKWTAVDPRAWAKRTDFRINVGLGTGTPEQQLQKLLMLMPVAQQGQALGLVGPQEAYNLGVEIWRAAGYRNADRFIREPQRDEQGNPIQPPPQKDPMVQSAEIKAQSEAQKAQMQTQADAQKFQAQVQADGQKFQADIAAKERQAERDAALKREEMQMSLQVQAANDQRQAELDRQKAALDVLKLEKEYEFKRWEVEFNAGVKVQVEGMRAQAPAKANGSDGAAMAELRDLISAPREIVRDEKTGKVIGSRVQRRTQ